MYLPNTHINPPSPTRRQEAGRIRMRDIAHAAPRSLALAFLDVLTLIPLTLILILILRVPAACKRACEMTRMRAQQRKERAAAAEAAAAAQAGRQDGAMGGDGGGGEAAAGEDGGQGMELGVMHQQPEHARAAAM